MAVGNLDGKRERDEISGHGSPEGRDRAPLNWDKLPSMIHQFGEFARSDRVLDMPCADGALAFEIARTCGYVVGADASEVMIATAATRAVEDGLDNTSFQVGNAQHLEFADGMFDRTVCWDGLHHFAEPVAVLRELARVLRSPGYLILVDIDASEDRAWCETHNRIERSRDPSHTRLFTRTEMRTLLMDNGMAIEREARWRVRRPFDFWMATVTPDEGTLERTHRLLVEAARRKSTGLEINVKGKSIDVIHRLAAFVAVKLG